MASRVSCRAPASVLAGRRRPTAAGARTWLTPARPVAVRGQIPVPAGVVAQEQFLQRRRLAHERADAGRNDGGQQRVELVGVDLAADPGAAILTGVQHEIMHARQPVEPGHRAGQLGRDRRAGQVPQPGQRAGLDGAARSDDRHPVAQRLDLGQDVARQQDRAAARPLILRALPEHGFHQRVESRRRLVQDQQLGVGGERRHQRHLLPVALGIRARLLRRIEVEALQQLGPALGIEPTAQPAEQVDDLAAGQVRPQGHVAGHVGEPAVQLHRLPPRVAAEQHGAAAVGPQEPEQHPDRGRLAAAVRAEKPVYLARGYGEVQPVECN